MGIEELDQRPHEEGGDDGADAGNGRNLRKGTSGQKENTHTQNHAYQIAANTHILELPPFPLAGQDDCHGIIGGNTQISSHIQRRTEANDYNTDDQTQAPHQQRRIRQPVLEKRIGKLGNIAQQKQIDKGGNADVLAVGDQAESQQH